MRTLGSLMLLCFCTMAYSQIDAVHLYNGVGRPLLVDVKIPKSDKGPAEILLLKAVSAEVIQKVPTTAGMHDLAKMVRDLWSKKSPDVMYAQLAVGGMKVGPALVLQPMMNPQISRLKSDGKTVEFVSDDDGPMFNGYRAYVDQNIVLETSLGRMEFRMRPDAAPNTVWTIMQLVAGGMYTDTIWHRVVAKRADGTPFVIQGGDPTGTGSGGPGFAYPLEDSSLPHDFGVISIARSTDPNTNGCQFFVCLSREGTKHLDHHYAAFGQCIEGAEAILHTAAVKTGENDRPGNPPRIRRAYLVPAKPYGEGPAPVQRPAGE